MKLALGILLAALTVQPLNLVSPNFSTRVSGVTKEYSIPWNADYNCEVAASGFNNSKGDKLSTTMHLLQGDVVKIETQVRPTQQTVVGTTLVCNGGSSTSFYLNGNKQCTVAGDTALLPATVPDNINQVIIYNSDNKNSKTLPVHRHTGNTVTGGACYATPVYHVHTEDCYDPGCEGHNDVPDDLKGTDGLYYCDDPWCMPTLKCNKGSTIESYQFSCPYSNGQILNPSIPAAVADYNPYRWTVTEDTNIGSGYGSVQLAECSKLNIDSTLPTSFLLDGWQYNVIITEDTVVYCKHGNLN